MSADKDARIAELEAEVERQDCEFDAEMDRLEGRILGDEQCCQDACDGGACESCPGCCAGWCVNGHDFRGNDEWDRMSDEDRSVWYDVAREGNAGLDAALTRADAAEVALAEVRETLAKVAALADEWCDKARSGRLSGSGLLVAAVAACGGDLRAALASAGRPSDGDVANVDWLDEYASPVVAPSAGACCDLHRVPCCDPVDCGPCCENCPTCPTLARTR